MQQIRLIVGLGNPGKEYEKTRHNAGYWWVDAIASAKGAQWKKETKYSGWTSKVSEGGADFLLLKPSTYMNESGRSVSSFARFFRIEPAQILVVHDELDLAPGAIKLKLGGGTGGHNGLTDIVEAIASKDFWRMRVGIGHPGDRDLVADYVLDKPRKVELGAIEPPFERSYGLLEWLAKGRMQDAIAWLHTSPEDEAKRKAALEARKDVPVTPRFASQGPETGTQLPKESK